MKKMKKMLSSVLMMGLGVSTMLAGCGNNNTASSNSTDPSVIPGSTQVVTENKTSAETTLKVLFKGPKPEGFDAVYEEFLNRTKDTLNIKLDITWIEHSDYKEKLNLEMTAGADYDLVFDAPWVLLKTLSADGYYADLSKYFRNDEYPGLKLAFSDTILDSNVWFDSQCYIPLYRSLGNGVPAVHYRQDWADEWGIGEIDSYDELITYWDKAQENGILPLSARNNRGYFQLFTIGGGSLDAVKAGVQGHSIGGLTYYTYIKDGQLVDIAIEGEGDEAFAKFPESFNYDFALERYETFADWTEKGYVSSDSMTVTDEKVPFYSGQAASMIGTLDDIETNATQIKAYDSAAVIGEFIYDENCRNMIDGAIPTSYIANNGLAVPASSKNVDEVMKFMDWIFSDSANHDLLELGIEGKDYNLVSEESYEKVSTYDFPGYGFTWNPNYVKFSLQIEGKNLDYRKWELKESSYYPTPIRGFTFNSSDPDVATKIAQVKAVTDKIAMTKLHGILSDGSQNYASAKEMIQKNVAEAKATGGDSLKEELRTQLTEFLAK